MVQVTDFDKKYIQYYTRSFVASFFLCAIAETSFPALAAIFLGYADVFTIGVRAPLDLGEGGGGGGGGAVTLLPEKITQYARNHVLYKRTQIAVKTKTFTILTSYKRIIIPKLQLNPDFSKFSGKRKLVRKTRYFEKSGVTKITMFDWRGKRLLSRVIGRFSSKK